MSELWQTTLFIVIGGWLFTLTGAFVGTIFILITRVNDVGNRVTRLETAFELMGNRTIQALHSPDDHLELDGLVEKYMENNYDLPLEDWETVKETCEKIAGDTARKREDRLTAGLAAGTAGCFRSESLHDVHEVLGTVVLNC